MSTQRSRKLAAGVLSAVLAIGLVAGCGAKEAPETSAKPDAAKNEPAKNEPAKTVPAGMVDTSKYKKAGPWKIAHASQGPTNSWALMYDAHIEWAIKEKYKGKFSDYFYADANGNADKQVNDVEDLLTKKPDLLIVTPMGSAALVGVVEKAMDMGIPVVLGAANVKTDKYVSFVTRSNYEAGKAQAEWLAKKLNGKGNILMLSGIAGVSTAEDRLKAAKEVFAKYPDIKVLGHAYANWSPAEAKKTAATWVAQFPQVDGFWSDGGQMAMGVMQAFQEAGKKIPPITGEPMNGFLRIGIENKAEFFGTGFPNAMGVDIVDQAVKILSGEPVAKTLEVDALTFDNTQASQYYKPKFNDDYWADAKLPDDYVASKLKFSK